MEGATPTTDKPLRVVGVKFKTAGTISDFDTNGLDVEVGDRVLVESDRGSALATVATPPRVWAPEGERGRPLRVLKKADEHDFAREDENRRGERETHRWIRDMIHDRGLEMKLVKVEY